MRVLGLCVGLLGTVSLKAWSYDRRVGLDELLFSMNCMRQLLLTLGDARSFQDLCEGENYWRHHPNNQGLPYRTFLSFRGAMCRAPAVAALAESICDQRDRPAEKRQEYTASVCHVQSLQTLGQNSSLQTLQTLLLQPDSLSLTVYFQFQKKFLQKFLCTRRSLVGLPSDLQSLAHSHCSSYTHQGEDDL